jgi:hypothetical protein
MRWKILLQKGHSSNKISMLDLAGAGGIEPPNGGIKIRCLTTWLRPNRMTKNGAEELATADSRWSQPVYRERSGISTAWRGKIPQPPAADVPHLIIGLVIIIGLATARSGPARSLDPDS